MKWRDESFEELRLAVEMKKSLLSEKVLTKLGGKNVCEDSHSSRSR